MPHHSTKPTTSAAAAYSTTTNNGAPTSHLSSQKSFPPTDYSTGSSHGTRGSIPSSMSMPSSSSNGHAPSNSNTSTSFQQSQPLFHRVPDSPAEGLTKNDDADKPSESNVEQQQAEQSQSLHDDDNQHSSEMSAAANVLLLAAAASKESRMLQQDGETTDDADNSTITSNGPLKKRKTVVDILRQKPDAASGPNADPYHVSPMSHGSKTTMNESTTPNSSAMSSTSRALSYESKEDPTKTSKNNAASTTNSPKSAIQFPSHSLVPYFPSALHWLLTESSSQNAGPEYAAARSVLQWVPHGQAFRVVRWDALRKQVLPQFFPQLVASMDAFLWHLSAWGFEEIQDGPDVGAFGHTVRYLLGDLLTLLALAK